MTVTQGRSKATVPREYFFFSDQNKKAICYNSDFPGKKLTDNVAAGSHIIMYDAKDKPLRTEKSDWTSATYLVTNKVTGWPDKNRIGFLARNIATGKYFSIGTLYRQFREYNAQQASVPMLIGDFVETSVVADAWAIIPEKNKDTFLAQMQPARLSRHFLGVDSIPLFTQRHQYLPERGYEAVEPGQVKFYPSITKRPSVYLLDCP